MLTKGAKNAEAGVVPSMDDPKVKLGQALFFDKLVSGNQDIACSTCHHPLFGTSDALPTSIGIGGNNIGPNRPLSGVPDRILIPFPPPKAYGPGGQPQEGCPAPRRGL